MLIGMGDYAFFVKDPSQWEESNKALWGYHNICPSLPRFHMALVTCPELSALSHSDAWGDAKKLWSDLAFLMIVPENTIQGEVAFSLTVVWTHPYQTCLSSMDKVAKKLTLLINSGDNWAFALCSSMRMPNMWPSLKRATLVP